MSKQTAEEWYEQELINFYGSVSKYNSKYEIIKQAKEMEKQQIIDARNDMQKSCIELANKINPHLFEFDKKDGEQYYNQTFNK